MAFPFSAWNQTLPLEPAVLKAKFKARTKPYSAVPDTYPFALARKAGDTDQVLAAPDPSGNT